MANTNDTNKSNSHFDYERLIKKVSKFIRSKADVTPEQVKAKFTPTAVAGKCEVKTTLKDDEFSIVASVTVELGVGGVWCGQQTVRAVYACGENYFEKIETFFNSVAGITKNRFHGDEQRVALFDALSDWIDSAVVAAVDAAVLLELVPAGAAYQQLAALESQSKPKKKLAKKKK